MEREAAFQHAASMISALPTRKAGVQFWDAPDLGNALYRRAWRDAAARLAEFANRVPPEVSAYFLSWASDAAVGCGEMHLALELHPVPILGSRSGSAASNRLNLKMEIGAAIDARDITSLFGPKVTAFGKRNIDAVERHIQLQIDSLATEGTPLSVEPWTIDAHLHPAGYSLFNGHASYIVTKPPRGWHFPLSPTAEQDCVRMIREAENTWREECDIPRVGEGWIAETHLFYSLKHALTHLTVVQHHRPDWLGRQHLDVAIPELKIAIEYQGAQHDQPIAFFGGEEAFIRTVERDRRKLTRCRRNGWRLIYVREGYAIGEVLATILEN